MSLYIGGAMGPRIMMDWYSDNGMAPRSGPAATTTAAIIPTSSISGGGGGGGDTVLADLGTLYNKAIAAGNATAANSYHQQANQYRNKLGLIAGVDYDPATGANLRTTAQAINPATQTQQTGLQQVINMINTKQQQQQQVVPPVYPQPDYSAIIPAPTQGVSATADPSQTTFIPTARYNDRVQQAKAQADAQAAQVFNANMDIYNSNRAAQQQQISNLVSLLPYTETTATQKAELENQKAAAALDAQIQAQKAEQWQKEYDQKQAQIEADAAYKQAALAAKKTGGSAPKPTKEPTTINQRNTQAVIAKLLPHNATGRKNLFNKHSAYWAQNGVDITAVMDALGL